MKQKQDENVAINGVEGVGIPCSPAMRTIYNKVARVAGLDCSVLLCGETGVGKDYLAHYIHRISGHARTGDLVKVNCGAIPENLLESELFGYERGAFTGASREGKAGLFEMAQNGTIFLDEIGDMPFHLQVKLLNSIQDRQFYRVGGTTVIDFNARIITATNADLEQRIAQGKFRLDLFYRINLVTIDIPPLRERREDILPYAQKFLAEFNEKYGRHCHFTPAGEAQLLHYAWPGNLREMRNVVERAVIMGEQDGLQPEDFFAVGGMPPAAIPPGEGKTLKERMEEFEAACIRQSLDLYPTTREAADALGVDLSTLIRKKNRYQLKKNG